MKIRILNLIITKMLQLYDEIINPDITVRRITISANALKPKSENYVQMDLFTDYKQDEQEEKLQAALLSIQERFGKNAVLKGTSYLEGATTKDRNSQIGGHRS